MSVRPRRLFRLVLVMGLLLSIVPAAATAAEPVTTSVAMPSEASIATAERSALDKINAERTKRGLVKLRLYGPIADLARERADYMAETDKLSHTHSGGQAVWDMMSAEGITWYDAGEIIAYNSTSKLTSSATTAVKTWMASAPHKAIAMSNRYNYVAFGLAVSPRTGRRYWAGVFLKGPDQTGAWSKIVSVAKSSLSSTETRVTIRWDGADRKLATLTSGFRYFDIQRSKDGGPWYDYGHTTKRSMVKHWTKGHVSVVRVRARDKAGNWGSWKSVTINP